MFLVAKSQGGITFLDSNGEAVKKDEKPGFLGKYFGCWIAALSPDGKLLASRGPTD